ncbi:MAG: cysteine--tRNA ligase [Patescibacteria group bacterium]
MQKFYNSLGQKIQFFRPLKRNRVSIYSCGPTVYGVPHIGNLAAFLTADLLKRYLKWSRVKVTHVMNITDVDDKTIKGARSAGISLESYVKPYTQAFFHDLKELNVEPADYYPRATEYISQIVELVKKLLEKSYAYKGSDNSTYYNIAKFRRYGELVRLKRQKLKIGARVSSDDYDKEGASDFALWKAWTPEDGDIFWDTEIGKGRPGWHIECSAMSMALLGPTLDIHTGAIDLKFPHHTNEIAQSEAATGKPFVRYWLHRAFLQMGKEKMAKRTGNVLKLEDLKQEGFSPRIFRYLVLVNHYRTPLVYTKESMAGAKNSLDSIDEFVRRPEAIKMFNSRYTADSEIKKTRQDIKKYLDDDLNAPRAAAVLFRFIRKINQEINKAKLSAKEAKKILAFLKDLDQIWGFIFWPEDKRELTPEVESLLAGRKQARLARDFVKSDQIRQELLKKGIEVRDGKDGEQTWVFTK